MELVDVTAQRLTVPPLQVQVLVMQGVGGAKPMRRRHQILDLVGRHPYLTLDQLIGLRLARRVAQRSGLREAAL